MASERNYAPRIIGYEQSKSREVLSKNFTKGIEGILIDIMDFSNTRNGLGIIGTHKGLKAEQALKYVAEMGGHFALIITSGNAGHAFDMESVYHLESPGSPGIQIIKFMKDTKGLIDINHSNGNYQNPSITIKLPDKWMTPKKLENFWKNFKNDSISPWRHSKVYEKDENYNDLLTLIKNKGLDFKKSHDVTNFLDFSKENPYLIPEIERAVEDYDHCIVQVGSGELALAFLEARKNLRGFKGGLGNKPANLLFVTGIDNPFYPDVFTGQSLKGMDGSASMLSTPKLGRAHLELRRMALDDKGVYFCGLGDSNIEKANGKLNSLIERDPAGYVFGDIRTSTTGSSSFGALDKAKPYRGRLDVLGAYKFQSHWASSFRSVLNFKDYAIKSGESVCMVNTGGKV